MSNVSKHDFVHVRTLQINQTESLISLDGDARSVPEEAFASSFTFELALNEHRSHTHVVLREMYIPVEGCLWHVAHKEQQPVSRGILRKSFLSSPTRQRAAVGQFLRKSRSLAAAPSTACVQRQVAIKCSRLFLTAAATRGPT